MPFTQQEERDLNDAVLMLENPGLAAKLANYLAVPLERGLKSLPDGANKKIVKITQAALMQAAKAAVSTMRGPRGTAKSNKIHKAIAAATGGVGGFFGLLALPVELPLSTVVMMRSILDIARAEGEDVQSFETKLAALEVFALGGPGNKDDNSDIGYYAVRAALSSHVLVAANYMAKISAEQAGKGGAAAAAAIVKSMVEENAPVIVRLIAAVAQRFSVQVSEKIMAESIPIVGAAGGAAVNFLFMAHYQDMARGHFTVRRLERKYGKEAVAEMYKKYKEEAEKRKEKQLLR